MAAKSRPSASLRDFLVLHVQAAQQRDDLLEDIRRLRAAGKIGEAEKALKVAEDIGGLPPIIAKSSQVVHYLVHRQR
jgi:hypothetical protein